ncbi:2'-5' RNA ligase family protein [Corynebacterium crudilactis]|uniref:2'-5' RNA ligase n=1 Tax=Corynebacterium crudilactis TaxID=1652495 RepID=A0A172QSI1_9CORY|nr:2'-5' RNA ligase family protein [Corynebacterium crudilactis]ANE03646.1 2'-5' RNA ligase [Corynebacterium crudilactis]
MASPENILLYLDPAEEKYIREIFDRLEERGFPRQNQTPHITITFSPMMPADVVQRAATLLPSEIPARFARVGTVVFGTKRKQTVAWLLEASEELEAAARELSGLNPDGRGRRWTPHLTMGLRLPKEIVPEYLYALNEVTSTHFKEITAVTAAYWKPQTQELRVFSDSEVS